MNSQLRNLLLVSVAAAIPLSLAAQSPSTPSSSSSSTSPSSSASTSTRSSTDSSLSTTPSSSSSGTMAPAENIRRLNDDALDHQFTAKDLIGKELYDRSGKRIGEVKDVVLASSTNPQLASSLNTRKEATSANYSKSKGSSTSGSGTTRTASGSVGGVGATGSVTTDDSGVAVTGSAGRTRSGDTSGTSAASEMARHAGSMMGAMSEDAVIVSYGGFLGAGNSLIRVPLSQLNYDASNKHIMINIAESELASLPEITETTRSAAE